MCPTTQTTQLLEKLFKITSARLCLENKVNEETNYRMNTFTIPHYMWTNVTLYALSGRAIKITYMQKKKVMCVVYCYKICSNIYWRYPVQI